MKLIIGNSSSILENLSVEHYKQLKKLLFYSTVPRPDYTGAFRAMHIPLISKKGSFPTGLLYVVKDWLKSNSIRCQVIDTRKRPESHPGLFKLELGYTPYPQQIAAAKAAALKHRGIIVAPTGVGKSVIIALMIQELQVPTLVVVPSLTLKTQLTQGLQTFFGADKAGDLKSGKSIAVENVDALDPSKPLSQYSCVILDEFHHSASATYRELNKKAWGSIYYRFGLTATPFRSQEGERLLLESVLSKVIYRISYKTAIEEGFIVPMEAYYYNLPSIDIKGNQRSWPIMYKELVVDNVYRNELIKKMLITLNNMGTSTLCLVKEIAHGDKLSEITGFDFVKGENSDNRIKILEFCLREKNVLIGTTGVLGEGVDSKPAEVVIIAGLGKSKNALMQQFGRVFRKYPGKESATVILFNDPSHKWTKDHFKTQCKLLVDEYGVKPIELEIESERSNENF